MSWILNYIKSKLSRRASNHDESNDDLDCGITDSDRVFFSAISSRPIDTWPSELEIENRMRSHCLDSCHARMSLLDDAHEGASRWEAHCHGDHKTKRRKEYGPYK